MIRAKNIVVIYNRGTPMETHALRGLDLEIPAGQFVTVIGSNGAGKSTVLNVLTGDAAIHEGFVSIDEQDVTGWSAPGFWPWPIRRRGWSKPASRPATTACRRTKSMR